MKSKVTLEKKQFRADIQVFRGIAVLAVVTNHVSLNLFPNAYLGVDIFFVISGVVVTPLICRVLNLNKTQTKIELQKFYLRRIYRLAPALIVTSFFTLLLLLATAKTSELSRTFTQVMFTFLMVGNFSLQFTNGNYFNPDPNPYLHTWSLSVEEQIYLLMPIALILCFRTRIKIQFLIWATMGFSWIFFVTPSILDYIFAQNLNQLQVLSFYSFHTRIWEFLVGSLVAIGTTKALRLTSDKGYWAILIALLVLVFSPVTLNVAISSTLCVLLTAIILSNPRPLKNRLLHWVGDRSYSIYLVHMPLLYIAKFSPMIESQLRLVSLAVSLVATFTLGALQYKLIEMKFRRGYEGVRLNNVTHSLKTIMLFSILPVVIVSLLLTLIKSDFRFFSLYSGRDSQASFLLANDCIEKYFDPVKCRFTSQKATSKNPNPRSLLLVGDSQADAVSAGVRLVAFSLKMDFIGSSLGGCPFLLVEVQPKAEVDCLEHNRRIISYIEKDPPAILIVANRTQGYLNPKEKWRILFDQEGSPADSRSSALNLYSKQLKTIAKKSKMLGIKLVLIQNIPELSADFKPTTLLEHWLFNKKFTKEPKVILDSELRQVERKIAFENDFILFDPSSVLCNLSCTETVFAMRDYQDEWHVSVEGAKRIARKLKKKLTQHDL